ncbi:hypothetical protein ACSHWO_38090 (plasmid) [Streptomyces sp. HUAS TT3]|uniref:hypothetical protein n=1 Tax=Streptomyces sp. HUAS TT3 TaxID=3447510 RepID=UPI003F656A12
MRASGRLNSVSLKQQSWWARRSELAYVAAVAVAVAVADALFSSAWRPGPAS